MAVVAARTGSVRGLVPYRTAPIGSEGMGRGGGGTHTHDPVVHRCPPSTVHPPRPKHPHSLTRHPSPFPPVQHTGRTHRVTDVREPLPIVWLFTHSCAPLVAMLSPVTMTAPHATRCHPSLCMVAGDYDVHHPMCGRVYGGCACGRVWIGVWIGCGGRDG